MKKKLVIGLAGEISAGKGTVAEYLKKKYGASVYRFSDVLYDVADRFHLLKSRENLQKISTIFRQEFGDDILSETIFNDVKKDKNPLIVIDGVRRQADIKFMKKIKNFKLVFIDADIEKRFKRIKKRGEKSDDRKKTFKEFVADHGREAEREIGSLKKIADFVIDNNGKFSDLYRQVENIV